MRAAALGLCLAVAARASEAGSVFVDPEDGWLDLSAFLEKAYGFVPVLSPVTEPAIGYGAAGGLVFIDREQGAPRGARPDLYLAGGMYTESQSWAALGAYSGTWRDGDLRTLAAGGYLSLNLKHYGLGKDAALAANPVSYNLRTALAGTSAALRIPGTPLFGGLGLVVARANLDVHGSIAGAQSTGTTLLALRPLLQLDTRDNIFTPTQGFFAESAVAITHQSGGGWFELLDLTAIAYAPLLPDLYGGARALAGFSFGNAPFYLRPYVGLRGAPALRYQGEQAASLELELRWQFWKRFSLVGFGGAGAAWTGFVDADRSESVFTYGTGLRYELARRHGLHMGADFAFGQGGFVLYIQFGSAWGRL
jgi:hypothetical protein